MNDKTQNEKDNGFNNILESNLKKSKNYAPKKSKDKPKQQAPKMNKGHKEPKNTNKIKKSSSSNNSVFHSTRIKKPSKYGNIRVKQDVVDKLGVLQLIVGTHSRSDLLEQMIKQCKGAILNTSSKSKFYKNSLDRIKEDRKFQSKNMK